MGHIGNRFAVLESVAQRSEADSILERASRSLSRQVFINFAYFSYICAKYGVIWTPKTDEISTLASRLGSTKIVVWRKSDLQK